MICLKSRLKKTYRDHTEEDCGYIEEGVVYEAYDASGSGFNIESNDGVEIYCLFEDCGHLGGGSWEIVEGSIEEAISSEQRNNESNNKIRFGDPNFKTYTLEEIEELLEYSEINECGVDEAFGNNYVAESILRSMVEFIKENHS